MTGVQTCALPIFPEVFKTVNSYLKEGVIIVVKGKMLSRKGKDGKLSGPRNIIIDELRDINEIYQLVKLIRIDTTGISPDKLPLIRKKLEHFPGQVPVHLQIDTRNHKSVEIKVGRNLYVTPSEVLMDEIKVIVGENAFHVVL